MLVFPIRGLWLFNGVFYELSVFCVRLRHWRQGEGEHNNTEQHMKETQQKQHDENRINPQPNKHKHSKNTVSLKHKTGVAMQPGYINPKHMFGTATMTNVLRRVRTWHARRRFPGERWQTQPCKTLNTQRQQLICIYIYIYKDMDIKKRMEHGPRKQ